MKTDINNHPGFRFECVARRSVLQPRADPFRASQLVHQEQDAR